MVAPCSATGMPSGSTADAAATGGRWRSSASSSAGMPRRSVVMTANRRGDQCPAAWNAASPMPTTGASVSSRAALDAGVAEAGDQVGVVRRGARERAPTTSAAATTASASLSIDVGPARATRPSPRSPSGSVSRATWPIAVGVPGVGVRVDAGRGGTPASLSARRRLEVRAERVVVVAREERPEPGAATISPSAKTVSPRTSVRTTRARTRRPSNGDHGFFENCWLFASTTHSVVEVVEGDVGVGARAAASPCAGRGRRCGPRSSTRSGRTRRAACLGGGRPRRARAAPSPGSPGSRASAAKMSAQPGSFSSSV